MQGRGFSSAAYRYGFNGKEKETDGTADNYDFGARIYDGRLGRWLSVDPLWHKYSENTPYNFAVLSPILIIDIDGRDIVNGAQVQLETSTDYYNSKREELDNMQEVYGSTKKEVKAYCKNHKFSRAETKTILRSIKNLISETEDARLLMEQAKTDVKRIDELICNLELTSPLIYGTMNSIKDDFNNPIDVVITLEHLMQPILASAETGHKDNGGYVVFDEDWDRINSGGYQNSILVVIERNIDNYNMFSENSGQDPLRHELGHAFYMITQSQTYRTYKNELKVHNIEYMDGHNDDDLSGKWAYYFGSNIDVDVKNTKIE